MEKAAEMTSGKPGSSVSGSLFAGVGRYHLLVFFGCWLGGIFDGMDSNLYAVVQADAIGEVAQTVERAVISQIGSQVLFVFLLGWVVGGLVFGMVGDKFGRVKAMIFSILLYAIFTGACGLAQNPFQLGLFRFLTGMGIGGELVTIATLLSETWPERSRALAVGALITSYQVGVFLSGIISQSIYLGLEGSGFSPWRAVFFVGALPAVLAILIRLKLDEPEKWKIDQAARETQPGTDHAVPLVNIFRREHLKNLLTGGAAFGGLLIGYWASLAWIPTWIQDLLGATGDGTEKSIATAFHGFAAVLGCMIAGPMADTIGRRQTIVLVYIGAFASSALLFLTNATFSPVIYWEDALLGFFIGASQAIMYIYLPELFPTRIRATAVGFCLNIGRVATAIAVLFVGTLVAFFGGYANALLVFSSSYLLAALAGYLGHETKGQPLPD